MMKILITGGTGLIGSQLIKKLVEKNYEVVVLTRNPKKANEFYWNFSEGYIDEKALKNVQHIIHLVGAGIADKRWTKSRKKEIIDSRVQSTNFLYQKITEYKIPLQTFISASAIGFYGAITSQKIFKETAISGKDFLGNVCKQWEDSVQNFSSITRTVIFRTGIVLTKNGGALKKMKTPIIFPIGTGKQYIPWIHIDDLCAIYLKAIDDKKITGIYNAIAPEHHTNKTFSKSLAKQIKKPFLPINTPAFLLQLIFGEMAILLLRGSRVSSQKIRNTSFKFKFPSLKKALENLK